MYGSKKLLICCNIMIESFDLIKGIVSYCLLFFFLPACIVLAAAL